MDHQKVFEDIFTHYVHRDGAAELLAWMKNETEFFTAPASRKYHGNYPGGLAEHSLNVHNRLYQIAGLEAFGTNSHNHLLADDVKESVAIMGLLHDLCKHDVYHRKDDGSYYFNDPFPFGHGEKSVYLIQQFMKLTPEEALAIRWHMGRYDDAAGGRAFNAAMKATPWVWRLHEADMCATWEDEREEPDEE